MMQHAPPVFCSAGPSAAAAGTQTSQNTACSKCGVGGSGAEVSPRQCRNESLNSYSLVDQRLPIIKLKHSISIAPRICGAPGWWDCMT